HPLAILALIESAEASLASGKTNGLIEELDAALQKTNDKKLGARLRFMSARARFAQHDFAKAAELFHNAAQLHSEVAEQSLFNAALAWLELGNNTRFLQEYSELSARFPESSLRSELILEQGLVQASERNPNAEKTLSV